MMTIILRDEIIVTFVVNLDESTEIGNRVGIDVEGNLLDETIETLDRSLGLKDHHKNQGGNGMTLAPQAIDDHTASHVLTILT